MNVGEIYTRVIGLIDEYSANGELRTTAEDNIDYRLKFNRILDMIQKDMASVVRIAGTYSKTQFLIDNQLGKEKFDTYQYISTDTSYEAIGSLAYYFEVDGESVIYIEEETADDVWTILETINVPSAVTEMTAYKDLITASNVANNIRIRFSGDYPYQYCNVALYANTFKAASNIQPYELYIKYNMPDDFYQLDKITFRNFEYLDYNNNFTDFYWENPTTLFVRYDFKGKLEIRYWKVPDTILSSSTSPTDYDSTNLEVLETAQEVMVYGVAGNLLITENDKRGLATQFINLYESHKANLVGIDKTGEKLKIKTMWGRKR